MNCLNCGKQLNKRQSKYCSYDCMNKHRERKVLCTCKKCGKKFTIKQSEYNKGTRKFCSNKCRMERKIFICLRCGKEFEGHRCYNRVYCSKKCHYEARDLAGSKNPNWQGGIDKGRPERNLPEYKQWRADVFTRDNFTCKGCGQIGHELQAHHIKSWKHYPELRYEVSNGMTLCKQCHLSVRTRLIRRKPEMATSS